MEYDLNTHMRMVSDTRFGAGLRGYSVLKAAAPDAPFQVIVNLDFASVEAFHAAVAESGVKIMGDVPNFTDTHPHMQISEQAATFTA